MKRMISACLITGMLSLYGCSGNAENSSENEPAASSDTAVSEALTEAETTTENAPEDYIHGEEGYYNILEEYPDIKMRSQEGGTCWLYSAAMSIETAYAKNNGSIIDVDPLEMLGYAYDNSREEGFFVKENNNPKETGGWQWIVTETLSNGFGDFIEESAVILDPSDREAVKKNLHERGGVSIGVNDTDKKYKGWHGGYYTLNYSEKEYDHDITIIGYDDHFPKEYFNEPAYEDGAWICYNSSFGSAGFFYVSYCAPLEYGISHSLTDKYSEVLAYDAGNEQDTNIHIGTPTTTANVFHKAGTLTAVGTYNDYDNQDIKIEVYDANFRNVLYSQDAVLEYHGYHTIELDTPVDVTDYAIAVTYQKGAPVEGESIDFGAGEYVTKAESGQSYIFTGDNATGWKDLTDSDIQPFLGIDTTPGNCCLKALYR